MKDTPPISPNEVPRRRGAFSRLVRWFENVDDRALFRLVLIAWLLPMPIMNARAGGLQVMVPVRPIPKTCCLPCAMEGGKPAVPPAGCGTARACCICVTLADTFLFDSGDPVGADGITPAGRTPVVAEHRPLSVVKRPLVPPPQIA